VRCSLCQFEHELQPQQQPASSAAAAAAAGAAASEPTDADLVRFIPINASLMESIGHRRQLERMVREQQQLLQGRGGSNPCTYPDCAQPALFWCEECEGELCATHDRDLHPEVGAAAAAASSSAAHRRTPLSERAAARQAKMAARLAANGAKLRASVISLEQQTKQSVSGITARLEAEISRHQREVLAPLQAQLAAEKAAELASKALSAEIALLSDIDLLKHEARINQLVGAPVPPDGLLAGLSADRRSDLERLLQMSGVSLVSQQRD
jgi:hypothetical protein